MVSYEKYALKTGETRWRVHYRDPNHVTCVLSSWGLRFVQCFSAV